MSKTNPVVETLLSCGCWARRTLSAVTTDDLRSCSKHQELARPTVFFPKAWHVVCVGGCSWGAWCGQDADKARRLRHSHIALTVYDFVEETWRETLPEPSSDGMLDLFTPTPAPEAVPPF